MRIHITLRRDVSFPEALAKIKNLNVSHINESRALKFGVVTCDVPDHFDMNLINAMSEVQSIQIDDVKTI